MDIICLSVNGRLDFWMSGDDGGVGFGLAEAWVWGRRKVTIMVFGRVWSFGDFWAVGCIERWDWSWSLHWNWNEKSG